MNRRKSDRRKEDRRANSKRADLFKLMIGLFIVLLGAAYLASFFPAMQPTVVTDQSQAGSSKEESKQDYNSFRSQVLERDQILIAKYHDRKEKRRQESNQDHSVEFYERRLMELESQLDEKIVRGGEDKKGSLAWGIKQQIEKFKQDPPPQ